MVAPGHDYLDGMNAKAWEDWLESHAEHLAGAWLQIAKKGSSYPWVTIGEASDAALCFGWIDSNRNGLDQNSFLQRYSPRKVKSPWSKINVDRAEALIASGRMRPAGLREIDAAKQDGRWKAAYESQRAAGIPSGLDAALAENPAAKAAFDRLGKTGRYALVLPLLKATEERRVALVHKTVRRLEASALSLTGYRG